MIQLILLAPCSSIRKYKKTQTDRDKETGIT